MSDFIVSHFILGSNSFNSRKINFFIKTRFYIYIVQIKFHFSHFNKENLKGLQRILIIKRI